MNKNDEKESIEDKNWKEDYNSEQLNNLEAENNSAKDFLYFALDLLKTGIIVFVVAFCLRYFAIQPFVVDGESMMPNFVNNEYILAEKVSYLSGSPKRGDVVVFKYPNNPSVSYIKRVIGLPGEKVIIENNKVKIINKEHPEGIILTEEYLSAGSLTLAEGTSYGSFEKNIDSESYFVMGDNRQHSSDSREWGLLPKENIIGRAWLTILPADKFGIQHRIAYPNLTLKNLLTTTFAKE